MTYLVDVNVLCEPTKPVYEPKVARWLDEHETELELAPIVMGEIWRGVDALPLGKKRTDLTAWFNELRNRMPVLDWTTDTALIWAEMVNQVRRSGYTVGLMDTFIAAIARQHQLTVATRNVNDFARCGVPVVNPFA